MICSRMTIVVIVDVGMETKRIDTVCLYGGGGMIGGGCHHGCFCRRHHRGGGEWIMIPHWMGDCDAEWQWMMGSFCQGLVAAGVVVRRCERRVKNILVS